ncbi:5-methyltetrahydrofolate--homocysteine methyltransferase [hydrocarbon metagenome]|uniref:methionine synthase n=1 Tax=hydrocarbon metagenome TaxID=938273 RepID=A0A0W8E7H8_9ZZZZ
MTIKDINSILKNRIMVLDGAMGTLLQNQGLQPGQCPEWFGIENPAVLAEIHYQYVQAGSDIIQTNTFGANRCKLSEFGLAEKVEEINAEAVKIARQGARNKALVAASMGPTGKLLYPMGDVDFDYLYQVFAEQAVACEKAGADLISLETMTDIGEMRAALIAARYNTRLPVIAHMTFENSGRTMMGTDPLTALIILEALQPLAVGANCSGGARELLPVIETMGRYANIFLSVEPNAGIPQLVGGQTVFPDSPEEMAEYALKLRDAGANIIGGCCGSTPYHIQAIAKAVKGLTPSLRSRKVISALASRSNHVILGEDQPLAFIGERINPTARKKLAQDISAGSMQMVVEEARKQVDSGAPILDVNMGVPGIDEAAAMKKAVMDIQAAVDMPISIDSVNAEAVEEGLKNFVGRALINSTTGEEKHLKVILPLARKYGAAVLGLCLDETGIPDKAEDRVIIARRIYAKALEYGLRDEDIYIDCLVKTASAEQGQVMETLKALQILKRDLPVKTVLGISNVSHGLPAREILTSAYLAMAWAAGLDLPIINPFDEKVMDITRATAVLLNRDVNCTGYIEKYKDYKSGGTNHTGLPRHPVCSMCNIPDLVQEKPLTANISAASTAAEEKPAQSGIGQLIQQAVLKGERDNIESLLGQALLEEKMEPLQVVNNYLIPGIEKAGQLYDEKKYFLPQLMMAADTMKKAFAFVKPHLKGDEGKSSGVIIMATVEGDIHDIGKNIVCVLLENYGFEVIDLGKDVKAADILDAAVELKADIIGLSALMTTTMPRMKEVITGVRERGLKCRVIVGGAVLNQDYADQIGADGYGEDARKAVLVAQSLLKLY